MGFFKHLNSVLCTLNADAREPSEHCCRSSNTNATDSDELVDLVECLLLGIRYQTQFDLRELQQSLEFGKEFRRICGGHLLTGFAGD